MGEGEKIQKAKHTAAREARFWGWAAVAAGLYLAAMVAAKCWGVQ